MRSQGHDKRYKVEVADKMIIKAGRLDVEHAEYICYQKGQPNTAELHELLKTRYPERDYEIHETINGITIKRL